MKIGKKIKTLRKERKMTLDELSRKSGVQIATLSRMEHDVMTGTLQSHISICKTLGVSLSDFYRDLENAEKIVTVSKKEKSLVQPRKSSTEILTTKIADKKMMPLLVRLQKGGSTQKDPGTVGAEKFLYLLEGKLTAKIGKDVYNLLKGDSIYFDASLSHVLQNSGKTESRAIVVLSPPSA
ncbi:MAG: XRE family transcriptional regulator [Candidatus Omnitrophota bacterium]